jgi:cytochrome b6-f complex iron-sulfur subunit
MKRREFLKRTINVFIATSALIFSALFFRFVAPMFRRSSTEYFYLMPEEELPKRGVKKVEFPLQLDGRKKTGWIFISVVDSKVLALSPVCTHLGCIVTWDNNASEFVCPCHAGRYNCAGEVLSGPPPGPLARLPLKIDSGNVLIGWKV